MDQNDNPEEVKETIQMLVNKLDEIPDELPDVVDDYHRLFVYFIGNMFEAIRPQDIMEQNLICDQQREHGIDIYNVDESRFVVYQCKLPELDSIEGGKLCKFNKDIINEAEDALTFLTDDEGKAKGNKFVQHARNKYRKMRAACRQDNRPGKLEVVLAYFGELTELANQSLDELKETWEKDNDEFEIDIKTYDYQRISSELRLSLITPAHPKKITLGYKPKTEVHTNDWGYMLVPAFHFYKYFDQYKMGLFDLNVRSHLGTTHVNKEIEKTLRSFKGQKEFHLLNNGITISCTGWGGLKENAMDIYRPQIINGCQTVISIYRSYSEMESEANRRSFEEKCFVPVRIIQTQDNKLLDRVITASNFQNEMSPRNLRANTYEQRSLQNRFNQLQYKWFYEKKDGEFDSFRTFPTQGFKIKHYEYGKNQYRKISNEDLAKSWLSFIGFSSQASENIKAFELAEGDGNYDWLFLKRPKIVHWDSITKGPAIAFKDDYFESFSPIPEQYILSYLIYEFVKAYLPTHPWNKARCMDRLKENKIITEASSTEDINKALMEDDEYLRNQILLNMKEVIVELYSWIFCKTYGPITEDTAKAILNLEGLHSLFMEPDFKAYASELKGVNPKKLGNIILYTSMEFIREGVNRWQNRYKKEYQVAPRRIRFLHSSKVIAQMKSMLDETNEQTAEFGFKWKPGGKKFLETLPKLNI